MNRRNMLKTFGLGALVLAGGPLVAKRPATASPLSLHWSEAIGQGLKKIGSTPGSKTLLVLTNAGIGEMNGQSTLPYLDLIVEETGRTRGSGGLMNVQTPVTEDMWVALYDKATGKLAFIKDVDGPKIQVVDAAYDVILTPEKWAAARSGLLGARMFSVASIALVWAANAPWRLLRASEFHNHICPGLNSGYIMAEYALRNLPLAKGEHYVFVGAPPFCANDAFQSILDATVGKKGTFAMMADKGLLKKKHGKDFQTGEIVLRVNPKANTCKGVLLAVDDDMVAKDTGVSRKDLSPEGGSANPLFHISRVKRAVKLAETPLERKLTYVKASNAFEGDMALASEIMGRDFDPYEDLPGH